MTSGVRHNAHHVPTALVVPQPNALSERGLARPKQPRHRLVYDCHEGTTVCRAEGAAQYGRAHRGEIIGRYCLVIRSTTLQRRDRVTPGHGDAHEEWRSEEHTSELQSRFDLVCRLLLEKKKEKGMTRL